MSNSRALLMIALCIALIVVCALTYPTTAPNEQPVLIAASIVAVAAAVMFGMQFIPKRPLRPEPDGSIVIRGERARWALAAICAGVAASLLPIATDPAVTADWMDRWHIWLLVALLGAISAYLAWLTLRAPNLWRLDLAGVESLTGVRWRAPWSAVAALETVSTERGRIYLALRFEPGREPAMPILQGVARLLRTPPFAIGADGSAHDFDDIAAHATRLWRQARGVR